MGTAKKWDGTVKKIVPPTSEMLPAPMTDGVRCITVLGKTCRVMPLCCRKGYEKYMRMHQYAYN